MKAAGVVMFVFVQACVFSVDAQQANPVYAKDIEAKIKQVENGLGGWVQLDSDTTGWNLLNRMKFYRIKGVSIAVIHDYKIEWARGYGWADEGEKRPVTTNTLFQAGSISKSLNGVGVMKLVETGKLGLNDDINKYLRTWKFPYDSVSHGRVITLGNLLSHTGGLSVHGFPGYQRGDSIPTLSQVLNGQRPANTGAVRSIQEPGKSFIYSGGGTTISQVMVMDVTGIPYDQYMWQTVLKPMGMTNSSYTQPPLQSPNRATGYLWGEKEVPGKYHVYPEQAAAGLWTTPTDLGKYIMESQLSLAGKSAKVLSQATTLQRLTPYIDTITNNGSTTGLGVFITKRGKGKYFYHSGSDQGFLSQYWGSFEGGDGVVVMINADLPLIFIREIINSVSKVYGWQGFYQPEHRTTIKIGADTLKRYAGTYVLNGDTVSVKMMDGKLFYASNFMSLDHFEQLLFTASQKAFVYEESALTFLFNGDAITLKDQYGPDRVFKRQEGAVFSNRF